ncbi:MAG: hypothetical protein ACYDCM_08190 [Candidatus Acidiferrales bacterium]
MSKATPLYPSSLPLSTQHRYAGLEMLQEVPGIGRVTAGGPGRSVSEWR